MKRTKAAFAIMWMAAFSIMLQKAQAESPWVQISSLVTRAHLNDVHYLNTDTGWAVGDDGTIISTNDGGATWDLQISGTTQSLLSVHFTDANRGWAVGEGRAIVSTNDGGATWTTQTNDIMNHPGNSGDLLS